MWPVFFDVLNAASVFAVFFLFTVYFVVFMLDVYYFVITLPTINRHKCLDSCNIPN